jgi:hypothetical protein
MKHDTQFDEKIIELFKQGIRAPKISVVVGCGVNIEVNGGGWHNTTTKITQDKKSMIIFLKIEDKRKQW